MSNNQPIANKSVPANQSGIKEKEEDMFVLISRRNPWKDGKLVSSFDDKPLEKSRSADKGKSTKDNDGWETATLYGCQSSNK